MFSKNKYSNLLLTVGLGAIVLSSLLLLWTREGGPGYLCGSLVAVLATATAFWQKADWKKTRQTISWSNLWPLAFLIAVFAPLYLYRLYTVPWQMNTDEIVIMSTSQRLLATSGFDILGPSDYFGFPTLIFVIFGFLSKLIGGIDLAHFRIIHALSGVLIIVFSYLFFTQITDKKRALTFCFILGANHALFAISRMAMRDNTGLLLALLSLALGIYGVKNKSLFFSGLGGLIAGLGFYTYFPARIIPFIWLGSLFTLALFHYRAKLYRELLPHAAAFIVVLFVTALPVTLSTFTSNVDSFSYQKQQFLLFPEGRELQKTWTATTSGKEAWLINIKQGLTTFNNKLHDHGFIYPNYKHGFFDPLSGVLLWIGVVVILWKLWKGERTIGSVLSLIGFFSLYLSFALLITKAPNYTRLLVILPFTSVLVGTGVWSSAEFLSKLFRGRLKMILKNLLAFSLLCIIMFWNFHIFWDFAHKGITEGNDVGSTGRFIEKRSQDPQHVFLLATSISYPYYSWNNEAAWYSWMNFFVKNNNSTTVVNPILLENSLPSNSPFTVFMSKTLWQMHESNFRQRFSKIEITNMKKDGSLIAVSIE